MPKAGIDALFYTIALMLVVDIGLDFITAYYKHGNLVTDSSKIAKHYLYGYFIFDCFAVSNVYNLVNCLSITIVSNVLTL